jgi:hypothetical protein
MKRRRYLAHGREWHTEDEKLVSAVQRLHLVSSWSSHPAFCPKPHTPLHTGGKVTGSLARLRYIWPTAVLFALADLLRLPHRSRTLL